MLAHAHVHLLVVRVRSVADQLWRPIPGRLVLDPDDAALPLAALLLGEALPSPRRHAGSSRPAGGRG